MTETDMKDIAGTTRPAPGGEGRPEFFVGVWRSGWAASAARIGVLTAVMTPLLCGLVRYERAAAVKEALAAQAGPRFDPAAGAASMRRQAVVQFGDSRTLACSSLSVPGGRVVCPSGFGAIDGACGGDAPGDFLVTREGTGWLCPAPRSGGKAGGAYVLCCK